MMQTLPVAGAPNEITFGELRQRLMSRKWLIIGGTIFSSVLGILLAYYIRPVYRAEILMVPVAGDHADSGLGGLGQLGGLASLAGISLGQESDRKVEALATLKSRALTEAFIADQNLLPVLFEKQWDNTKSVWKTKKVKDIPTLWDGNKLFTKIRDVQEDKKTSLITVAIEWTDPELARKWVAEIVSRTNELLRKRAIERSESNISYIQIQLQAASVVEVRQALFRLIENEVKASMLAQSSGDYAFKIIDPAVVPEDKVRPNRPLIASLSFLLGLMLTSLYALINPPQR